MATVSHKASEAGEQNPEHMLIYDLIFDGFEENWPLVGEMWKGCLDPSDRSSWAYLVIIAVSYEVKVGGVWEESLL